MRRFSERMGRLQGSAIRQIMKLMSDPNIISLGGGNPAVESFPVETIREIANQLLLEKPGVMLQYGITSGYVPVTKSIRDYEPMKKFWEENPYYIAAYECLEWGVWPEFPTWPGLTDLNNSINALYHTLLEEGSITAEEAVEQFRAEIDGLF